MPKSLLYDFVEIFFQRKHLYLKAAEQNGSPLYILEPSILRKRAARFKNAFEPRLPGTSFYYAMKSNSFPGVSKILLEQGFGLDVSSGLELECALQLDAKDIIFSGPGKTKKELELAVTHNDRVTLLLDSVSEFTKLKTILGCLERPMKIGIRLNSNPNGLWRKFGIHPGDLLPLYYEVLTHPFMTFKGLQFHSSWNLTPDKQIEFLGVLGNLLETMPGIFRKNCDFIDIGGGYWPSQGEWLQSEDAMLHYCLPASPIEEFAEKLSDTIKKRILPYTDCRICFEPGRWICNDAMHILVSVIDKKAPDLVITDVGTNAVGWERFETDYFPVLNLTRSDMTERRCHILGALCTPHDVWGYAYFGKDIQEGDILMIPTQGAYTYSLRQQFIKPLPRVVTIDSG